MKLCHLTDLTLTAPDAYGATAYRHGVPWVGNEVHLYLPVADGDPIPTGYTDVSSLLGWNAFGPEIVARAVPANFVGMKDWLCLQAAVRALVAAAAGADWSTWDALSGFNQAIACAYLPREVPPARFAAAVPDAASRSRIRHAYNLRSREARLARLEAASVYLGGMVDDASFMAVMADLAGDLFTKWFLGIGSSATDGADGIFDYLQGSSGYSGGGLPAKVLTFYDGETTSPQLAAQLTTIFNGNY